jgi:multidrug efflux pump subunit AcrB
MRAIFSVLGLLVVVALVGFLAKKQLSDASNINIQPQDGAQVLVPKTTPGATPQQQSEQIGQQVKQSVEAAMQQQRPVVDDPK